MKKEKEYQNHLEILGDRNSYSKTDKEAVFMEHIKSNGYNFKNVVADAGYESYENLKHLEDKGYTAYIKPKKHEVGVKYIITREYKYRGLLRSVFTSQNEENK
ncbi:transposase [Streptobacillus canis]|uniref:transposase n=1 Tax=Streptobacillus canis TaxID=2678686 RepID=UPI0012E2C48B